MPADLAQPTTPRIALAALRDRMVALETRYAHELAGLSGPPLESARNLLHYVALREHDLRPLQKRLVTLGLSSLGRCEPWVLGSVRATARAAAALEADALADDPEGPPALSMRAGRDLLDARTDALFGAAPESRAVRIMVTMPDHAADDASFVADCVNRGMNAMRLNTAAGDPDAWARTIEHLRRAEAAAGRRCRVFADLAGPKIRVSALRTRKHATDQVRLRPGDTLLIAFGAHGGRPEKGTTLVHAEPARIIANLRAGDAVWFDDGKVGATVRTVTDHGAIAEVTFTKPAGQRLRVGKGMNLPDTPFEARALTDDDRRSLRVLWGSVDAVMLSFVRTPEDVADLRAALAELEAELGGPAPSIVLKIETREGFACLPELLLELLRSGGGGVMLARGDLAVECGFERMAEIQEELLCFCEAAHVPVIWATEVLSTLAKQGRPTRAEITDAAMAQRAECVMLNKGPEIPRALETLGDILRRMQSHQRKKTPMFRPLSIAVVRERG